MNQAKKLAAGVSVVVAIAAGAGFPAITGYMLENNIQERLEQSAAKFDFEVSSVEVNRSFRKTTIDVLLEGGGIRKLSQESLELSGVLEHNSLFDLPELITADLDFTYYMYQQGIKLGLPGSIVGAVSWNGAIDAAINTESLELPLDPMGTTTLQLQPVSGSLLIDGKGDDRDIALSINDLSWSVKENNAQLMSVTLEPSKVSVSGSGEEWSMSIPALALSASNTSEADLTLVDIQMSGEQRTEKQMLSSQMVLSTGQLTVPALAPMMADKVIEGLTMTSSVDNVSESALTQLGVLMQEVNLLDNKEAAEKAARKFLMALSGSNPRFALDDFTLKTKNGDMGISFEVEGTDQSTETLSTIINAKNLTKGQEDELTYQFMIGMNSSAKITLSDDLLDWSCKRVGEQVALEQGASAAEGEFIADMCKTMADSGQFMNVPCMEISDPAQQAQCMDTMNQAKAVWVESKTLTLVLKDGELMFNGASVELPATM